MIEISFFCVIDVVSYEKCRKRAKYNGWQKETNDCIVAESGRIWHVAEWARSRIAHILPEK